MGVFQNCSSLTDMYINGAVSYEPENGAFVYGAFHGVSYSMTIHAKEYIPIWWNIELDECYGRQHFKFDSTGRYMDEHVFSYRFTDDYSRMELCNYFRNVGNGNSSTLTLPSSFYGYSVTSIGPFAFNNDTIGWIHEYSDTLVFADTITSISGTALARTEFKHITIPDRVVCELLSISNSKLVELNIGNGVKSIDVITCIKLKSISIPDSVTSFEDGTFAQCEVLTTVKLSKNLKKVPFRCFENCSGITSMTIPSSVIEIGGYAFFGTSIKQLIVPSSVISIGPQFIGTSCAEVILNEGLQTISTSAFMNTNNVKLTIPSTVTTIGGEAFRNCLNLKSINIQCKTDKLPDFCFQDCSALQSVVIGPLVKSIGKFCFTDCTSLETVTFSEGLETIESNAFICCRKITSIKLPSTTRRLEGAFCHCTALTSITLNEGLIYIAQNAFAYSTALRSITIPSTVENAPTHFDNWSGKIN